LADKQKERAMAGLLRCLALILLMILPAAASGQTVRVATVHFGPVLANPTMNRAVLVQLTTQAAQGGAKIVVHTEMATSGYSFFSRQEISGVAETVPGPTTQALGAVASQYGIYVVVGLPEFDATTNLYYNSAVLIGPDGQVAGTYRKRNNLLEASYNAEEFGPIPVFNTPYGKLGIVICADLFYPQFPRLAALAGANILLAPANVGVDTNFLAVRAYENNFAVVVANRYGTEIAGSKTVVFDQNSFAIPSPFAYDFSYGSQSVIMTAGGQVLADITKPGNQIGYGDLPVVTTPNVFPAVRRPDLYSLMGQDTLESYTFTQFHLPPVATFAAAAVDPGASNPWGNAVTQAGVALQQAKQQGYTLRLVVLSAGRFASPDPTGMSNLMQFAQANNVDVLVTYGSSGAPISQLLTSTGNSYSYTRTHRMRNEPIPPSALGNSLWVVDRDYARVAFLQDPDLMAPETSVVLAKMGVDVAAVAANNGLTPATLSALWQSRTGNYINIVMANAQGVEGVYLGGYPPGPGFVEASGIAMTQMNTQYVRNKKEPRFLDFRPMLLPCSQANC
jgi:predicted amidohydrolase